MWRGRALVFSCEWVTPTSVNERIPPRWCRVSGIPTYPAPYPSFGAQTYTYIPFTVCPDYTYDRKYPNPAALQSSFLSQGAGRGLGC